ncbi:acetyl-CoA C-acetyltransferase [Nocardioides sp. zg-579]|uniref:Acetyl-CoA C-acetyltransferase n=1 Tax=Nocardioides marmotae TaxID=2663857 RepID=A0A6I3J2K0_9ACTN|nr:acetyl-CoA C-acetyltransferase [Nocardioides marmotae]MCR6031069.1 acetyl-CoA C-acetyltransferase [Gordonia jinghuaiqii]MTB94706.1 acetyl-CoA C-acetyltransferase [Nocardioides marmotae]QKE01292.1 acetyl-CoA C-acetyltransferase [Nocardioides marmotae]
MPEAFIVDAVRTPTGKRGGALAAMHSADLAAHSITALVDRTGVDPGAVDDVILGCCDTIGSQAGDVARTAWLAAGLPDHVPGVTIDRQCGSSQQAVHFAAQAVMSGTQDLVVAGGVQNMSAIPISAAMLVGQQYGFSTPFAESPGWQKRFGDQEVSQFRSAEMIAEKWGHTREQLEAYALASHERALTAIAEGRFDREVVPVPLADGSVFATDQCPRQTSLEKMASLQPLAPGGRITAAVASQICDASSAVLIASEQAVADHGLTPRARVHHLSVRGDDPVWMLTGPIRATRHALERSGLSVDDIDLFECNEAFAPVVLAWMEEIGVPHEKVNVNGGGIALGHPIGATGTRLMTTLLHELERTGGRYGLQTMCEGGGQANVTIIERL